MIKQSNFLGSVCALALLPFINGCVPVAMFGVGVAAIDMSTQERGIKGTYSDTEIRAKINSLWFNRDIDDLYRNVHLSVQNGYVLLTGVVPTEDIRVEAVKLAWQAKGVKEVYNELKIGEPQPVGASLEDVWISTKLRSTLVVENDIRSNNYSITTFEGVVYLMGIAQNQEELTKVIAVAKEIRGVQNVVSHVQMKEQEGESGSQPAAAQQGEQGSSESAQKKEDTSGFKDMSAEAYSSPGQSSTLPIGPNLDAGQIREERLSPPV